VKRELILGLDIGSSSVRGALFDDRGEMLRETFRAKQRRFSSTEDGGAELDAERAYRQVVRVIDGILDQASVVEGEITRIASCSFWHSLVGIDERGKPTTPVYGWADNRSREYVKILREDLDDARVHQRTGARFHSSFWPAKLLWMKSEAPDVWERTERWISFADLVAMRMCGASVRTSDSMATATGLYDLRKGDWDAELLEFLELTPADLPEIEHSPLPLSTRFTARRPRLEGALFDLTIGDGAANNIGSGCVGTRRAALMIGTSAAVRVVYKGEPRAKLPSGLWCYRAGGGYTAVGGALSDGGGLYDHLKRLLNVRRSDESIAAETARRGPDSHGLTLMPFFAGERGTGYNENARGAIIGLTMTNDAVDILQAAMEAVAYRLAELLGQLESVFPELEIVASGGALTSSAVWAQIVADVLGRDISLIDEPEASLRGAVLLALANTGKIDLADKISTSKNVKISCDRDRAAIYAKAGKRHQAAYAEQATIDQ
jgi:gluconokinase